MYRRRMHTVGFGLLLLLVSAACGPKSDVSKLLRSGGAGGAAGETSTGGTDTGTTTGDAGAAAGGTTTGGGTAAGAPGARTGTTTGTTGARTGTTAGGGGPQDKTGITDKEIVIGLHAPVTGAAPIPQTSFERGVNVYWEFVKKQGGILGGKNGKLLWRDDTFNPQRAVQVCRELVEREKVFVLIGGGGADQITACAKYAQSVGVPYFSAGVNEEGIANLSGYFAISMSYAQQSPLLAQMVKTRLQKKKIGITVADTPSFSDAFESMIKAAEAQGLEVVRKSKISKDADANQSQAETSAHQNAGAEVIYVLAAPTIFVQMAKGKAPTYSPTFIGPGLSAGLNTIAQLGCPDISGARFLSPFPQMDVIDQLDPDYGREYRAQNGNNAPDDFGLALWGLNKTLRFMMDAAGAGISRQSLISALETGKQIKTGVYPDLTYGPGKHLGAKTMHLLEADCSGGPQNWKWKTTDRFASGF